MKKVSLLVVCLCLSTSGVSVADMNLVVFSCDFEDGTVPSEISGPGVITDTQGYDAYGFGSNFLRNGSGGPLGQSGTPSVLTLTGLPTHTSVSILVDVAFLDTWDGSDPYYGPDYFNIEVDGQTLFREQISNGVHSQTFQPTPDDIIALPNANLFTGLGNEDSAYKFDNYLDCIPHTSSQLTVEWFADGSGWQGIIGAIPQDETWAIDNITVVLHGVEVSPVPVPGAFSLGALGIGFAGWLRRRKNA